MERDELKTRFPKLYRKPVTFEIGDGWIPLLWKLSKALEDEIKASPKEDQRDMYAVQIKSKYGLLNYYVSYGTDRMTKLINAAESASGEICEFCGGRGLTRDSYTACEEHKGMNN